MINPMNGRVVALPIEEEKESTLIKTDTAKKDAPTRAKVVVGNALYANGVPAVTVRKDSVVVFKPHVPDEVVDEGVTYLLIRISDIIAIIE